MHECPLCGSQSVTCKHCGWTWTPRDPENIPENCPRCRNKWREQFQWSVKSKYGQGTIDPLLRRQYRPKTESEEEEITA